MLSQQQILNLFDYLNGQLYWKSNGKIAGYYNGRYWILSMNSTHYKLHRVIWVMFNGEISDDLVIDHIDHEPKNNNIENLRCVTNQDNCKNLSRYSTNNSGQTGVHFFKSRNCWKVKIMDPTGKSYQKYFKDKELAIEHAKQKYIEFGYHENHGK